MPKMLKIPYRLVQKGIPITLWLPKYNLENFVSDLVAGITVGLTLIPQSIAYAALAGLSPEYGLYSSLISGITYTIFGTIPELNIAPTALLSLLTFSYTNGSPFGNVNAAILLCFLSGVVELACGLLHLGFLVDFVSSPVVAGFTSAGAITIASAQVKNLLGLHFEAESFTEVWTNVFEHIKETKKWDAILSVICCSFLLGLRQLKDFGTPPLAKSGKDKEQNDGFKKCVWFLSVSRNALVVIGCAMASFIFENYDLKPFSLTSQVPAGLPDVSLPKFEVVKGNHTYTFIEMARELGSGLAVVPFVAILGNVAIAKAFAHGKVVDASQEMFAVGICSIIGSFFSSYPINASFSRAAVGNASGIKTPLGGIYTGIMVFLALTFLTPYFSYIPKPTLSSVIICAVIFMVETAVTKLIWRINKMDLVPFVVTFLSCLFLGIEIGILIGICVDVIFLLYFSARPKILIETLMSEDGLEYLQITPTSSILFPSAEYIREKVMKENMVSGKDHQIVVIDCSRINRADFTAAKCIGSLVMDLKKDGKAVVFFRLEPSLAKVITGTCESQYVVADTNLELSSVIKGPRENGVNENKGRIIIQNENGIQIVLDDQTTKL